MSDNEIIDLLERRSEQGLQELKASYADYIYKISYSILGNREDSEECVNDVYLRIWASIPPNHPDELSSYIGKVTRNVAIDCRKRREAGKRGGGVCNAPLEKLENLFMSHDPHLEKEDSIQIQEALESFIRTLSNDEKEIFLHRYWDMMPIADLARDYGMTVAKVTSMLFRLRKRLGKFLKDKGISF